MRTCEKFVLKLLPSFLLEGRGCGGLNSCETDLRSVRLRLHVPVIQIALIGPLLKQGVK